MSISDSLRPRLQAWAGSKSLFFLPSSGRAEHLSTNEVHDLISQPPFLAMQLFALLPWFATLIANVGATTPESVEEAGRWPFYFYLFI